MDMLSAEQVAAACAFISDNGHADLAAKFAARASSSSSAAGVAATWARPAKAPRVAAATAPDAPDSAVAPGSAPASRAAAHDAWPAAAPPSKMAAGPTPRQGKPSVSLAGAPPAAPPPSGRSATAASARTAPPHAGRTAASKARSAGCAPPSLEIKKHLPKSAWHDRIVDWLEAHRGEWFGGEGGMHGGSRPGARVAALLSRELRAHGIFVSATHPSQAEAPPYEDTGPRFYASIIMAARAPP